MMENLPFDVQKWLSPKPEKAETTAPVVVSVKENTTESFNVEQDIERIVSSIESAGIDITADYDHWLNIAFGLAHELGEMGRSYFHRISRFFPRYDVAKTNMKYDSCLKNQHSGTTIKSFFFYAKQAGIDLTVEKKRLQFLYLKKQKMYLLIKKKIQPLIMKCLSKVNL